MRRSTTFFAVGLAVLGLQGMTAAAALGAAGDPVPGSPFASLAAVLQAIPADLMPPGIMTDEQAAALKAWSTQRLGEALDLALRYRCVGFDAVRHLLHQIANPWQQPLPLAALPPGLAVFAAPVRDLVQYNRLLASL